MKHRTFSVACTLCLLLTACLGGKDSAELDRARAARSGIRTGMELLQTAQTRENIPASDAGTRAGSLLSAPPGGEGEAIPTAPNGRTPDDRIGADMEFLDALLSLLRIDVQNFLNRAVDREEALREYIDSLASHAAKGRERLSELNDREEELNDDRRRIERSVRDLRNTLDEAVRGGESGRSSSLANDLVERQSDLAKIEAELTVTAPLRESYDDVLPAIEERLKAVEANRIPLIKGVRVVNIPGVEDLKIILPEERKSR